MDLTDEELMLLEQLTYLEDIVFEAAGIKDAPDIDQIHSVKELIDLFNETALAKLDGAGVLYSPQDLVPPYMWRRGR